VTAPLDKAALHAGGYDFPGHTEMLAARAGVPTTMMLASDRLRVVLATTHIPLRAVHAALTPAVIVQTAAATRAGLQTDFGIPAPRIALCALNPHAGDGGRFGAEDVELLAPAARAAGIAGIVGIAALLLQHFGQTGVVVFLHVHPPVEGQNSSKMTAQTMTQARAAMAPPQS
jgi:4-hydroxythreonine-4-phosphate dehydrogenase